MAEPPEKPPGGWPIYGEPEPPETPEPAHTPPAPAKKRNPALIVLGVIAVLVVLFCGGCLAFTDVIVVNEDGGTEEGFVDPESIDNLLEITPGVAFEVEGMEYAAGWSIQADDVGDLVIKKLRVTNNRDEPDDIVVEIRLWEAGELLAQADCSTELIPVGATVTPECFSADRVPKAFDYVTINDDY